MPKLAEPENPIHKLSAEQLEALGREFDELHEYVKEDLGERDAQSSARESTASRRCISIIATM